MSVGDSKHESAGYALNEADTCRKHIVPKLQAAGWDKDPHATAKQCYFTDGRIIVLTPEEPEHFEPADGNLAGDSLSSSTEERARVRSRKYHFDGGQVEVNTHLVYELDADSRQLGVVKLTDYMAERVRTLGANPDELGSAVNQVQALLYAD